MTDVRSKHNANDLIIAKPNQTPTLRNKLITPQKKNDQLKKGKLKKILILIVRIMLMMQMGSLKKRQTMKKSMTRKIM